MTIGIVVACKDGIVVGADRKVTRWRGTRIKSLEDKIYKLSFTDGRSLLVCSSGGGDVARRAIDQIDPREYGHNVSGCIYRDAVESKISWLQRDLATRGLEYDAVLLFGMIDVDDRAFIGHVLPTGLTETANTGYFTTGIAAPYAELVLKDSYSAEMAVLDAKLIVASLIHKIGTVDNDVEGTDVFCISTGKKKVEGLTWAETMGIRGKSPSLNFKEKLDELKQSVAWWHGMEKGFRQDAKKREKQQ